MPRTKIIIGSKLQVFRGTAERTAGGLVKSDLMQNKHGKVVSKKQHQAGLKASANLGSYLQGTVRRSTRKQKGAGFLGDLLGSATEPTKHIVEIRQGSGLRKTRPQQKGAGIVGDIANAVGSVGSLFGLGLSAPYASEGGKLPARRGRAWKL